MSFYFGGHQNHHHQPHHPAPHATASSHNHHGGRSRRAPRYSASQNSHRQFRGPKNIKEMQPEAPAVTAFRARFEAGRSFDLDDDLEFCPGLLTDEDVCFSEAGLAFPTLDIRLPSAHSETDCSLLQLHSIHSSSSDRSSLSSGSPESSPLQQQILPSQQVTTALSLSSASATYNPLAFANNQSQLKIHQPSAVRTRNAIPIVNPSTGMRVASPPSSISPGMMQAGRRW